MTIDDRAMLQALAEMNDLHSDGMRTTREGLQELVEVGLERRSTGEIESADRRAFIRKGIFAAGTLTGVGAAIFGRATISAFADTKDVDMLQTSASIENLAVAVYKQAAGLDPNVSGAAIPVVKAFVLAAIQHHTDHANAFNGAAQNLGGKAQTGVDTAVKSAVVDPAVAKIKGPADVVGLALTLEDAAAQTYTKFGSDATDANALKAWASIAPIEAGHAAVLLAVQALVAAGAPQLITIPLDLPKLPAAAGGVGFPNTFYPLDKARPADEGKVA